jgi:alanyl-tRNA synthetase
MTDTPVLNAHHKSEYPPMHTAEHILNKTMVDMFGCERSKNAHIERKKSKCDYSLEAAPTDAQIQEIEKRVNDVIHSQLDVTIEFVDRSEVPADIDLSKLPEDVSQTLRLVRIGNYDVCVCIGSHVQNTREIAPFKIISSDWNNGVWRVRFKLLEK